MHRLYIKIILLFSALSLETASFAQESLIDSVLQSRGSFVSVKAFSVDLFRSPKASAAIDPKTGRMLIARNIKSGYYEQTGAGVIIDETGYIVTNLHIVKYAKNVMVALHNNTKFIAQILYINPYYDLALLKIDVPFKLRPIEFADSNQVKLGDKVINVGHSDLLNNTLSGGIVTGLGSGTSKTGSSVELIRVNIEVFKGDSGGPLLDQKGRLIGMMVAKLVTKEKNSFAIPANKIKKLYLDFIN